MSKVVFFSLVLYLIGVGLGIPSLNAAPYCEFGAFVGNDDHRPPYAQEVRTFEELAGRHLHSINVFWAWNDGDFPLSDLIDGVRYHDGYDTGVTLMITWEPWSRIDPTDQSYSLEDIVAGVHDAYIRKFAQDCKLWKGTVRIRFAHEMVHDDNPATTDYYPWQDRPEIYKSAWARIHDIFRQEQADNVEFVWTPNSFPIDFAMIKKYYPGIDLVDWVGSSVFNAGEDGAPGWPYWQNIHDIVYPIYHVFVDNAEFFGNKPIMIAEMGCAETNEFDTHTKADWIRETFTVLQSQYTEIDAVYWFQKVKFHSVRVQDWRINSSPETLAAFQEAISDPFYWEHSGLADRGDEFPVNYAAYGSFFNTGTGDYFYTVGDSDGLVAATGEGIYPNSAGVYANPRYPEYLTAGKLDGSAGDFIDSVDPLADFFKWATDTEQPEGVKLFYIAHALENLREFQQAVKAYYALVVHFPFFSVTDSHSGTSWYPAIEAIDAIHRLLRDHPECGWDLLDAHITVTNGYDNDPGDDAFTAAPGQFSARSVADRLDRTVRRLNATDSLSRGTGRVRLVRRSDQSWQLRVDGAVFPVKGVVYQPTAVQDPTGSPNAWEWRDSNENGLIDAAQESWVDGNGNNFRELYEQTVGDFQLLQNMGCNCIRLYHYAGADHKTFQPDEHNKLLLRRLFNTHGIMVIMGDFLGAYTIGSGAQSSEGTDYTDPAQREAMSAVVRAMVQEYKDEPYVLLWLLGYENDAVVDHRGNATLTNASVCPQAYAEFLNTVAAEIHTLDPDHPVAVCNRGTGMLSYYGEFAPEVDIIGINHYAGRGGIGSVWLQDLRAAYVRTAADGIDRPVLLSEYGADAYTAGVGENASKQREYYEGNWRAIAYNGTNTPGDGAVLGGVVLEWLDGWWRDPAGVSDQHDVAFDRYWRILPDQYAHAEWFGICGQGYGTDSPFLRQPRQAYALHQNLWQPDIVYEDLPAEAYPAVKPDRISWPAYPGLTYAVEYSDDYANWTTLGHFRAEPDGRNNLDVRTNLFYRVSLSGTDPVEYIMQSPRQPVITVHPESTTAVAGLTHTFYVQINSGTAATYQWYRDGSAITGATANSYTTPVLQPTDDGAVYRVAVGNAQGTVLSHDATLRLAGEASGTAVFVHRDRQTQGNWHGVYGTQGYCIVMDHTDLPAYAAVTVPDAQQFLWSWATTEQRALQNSLNPEAVRQPACWFGDSFSVEVNFSDAQSHYVALYFLDWDGIGRRQMVQVLEKNTGAVIDQQLLDESFFDGEYLVWQVSGSVTVRIADTAGMNAVLSGIFISEGISGVAPGIAEQPESIHVIAGYPATFQVSAQGTEPLRYQWYRDGGAISGATTDRYTLENPGVSDSGAVFTVTVSNAYGQTSSSGAALTVSSVGTAGAEFVFQDTTTQGNWQRTYGADGYVVIGDSVNYPGYATVSASGNGQYTWDAVTTDARALETAAGSGRIAACWYGNEFTVAVNSSDGQPHTVALYMLDWDSTVRRQTIEVIDSATGALMDRRSLASDFHDGAYLVWHISGAVEFHISSDSASNSVLSGIFFGGAPDGTAPVITAQPQAVTVSEGQPAVFSVSADGTAPLTYRWEKDGVEISGATASSYTIAAVSMADDGAIYNVTVSNSYGSLSSSGAVLTVTPAVSAGAGFVQSDTSTQGNWQRAYGADGYVVIGDSADYPRYATVSGSGNNQYTWAASTSEPRALEKAAGADRIASCWYANSFDVTVAITDGQIHQVGLYFLDWDSSSRRQTIDVRDAATGATLDSRSLTSSFNGGVYFVWHISGAVEFHISSDSTSNSVLSGLFFGGAPDGTAPVITAQPQPVTVSEGQPAVFSVSADGTAPLSYQWEKNGVAISGATASSYTIATVSAADDGSVYCVTVSNSYGSVKSVDTVLSVSSGTNPSAMFVRTDSVTQGEWQEQYGTDGYNIIGDTIQYPGFSEISATGNSQFVWQESPGDVRALQKVGGGRIAACWYGYTIDITVAITDGQKHQVALYFLDWERAERRQTVQVFDPASGTELDLRRLDSSFSDGTYLVWDIRGTVTIHVSTDTAANAVLSGIFFGVASAGTAPSITVQPVSASVSEGQHATFSVSASGTAPLSYQWEKDGVSIAGANESSYTTETATSADNGAVYRVAVSNGYGSVLSENAVLTVTGGMGSSAIYLQSDSQTAGNWFANYGADGYVIIGDTINYPSYATASVSGNSQYIWAGSSSEVRALQKNGATDRIAACWYGNSFSVNVPIVDRQAHQVALYFLDWDSTSRRQTVEVLDAETGAVLDTRALSVSFNGGIYLIWNISGPVQFRVRSDLSSQTAVISGIFFGSAPSGISPLITQHPQSTLVAQGNTATFSVSAVGSGPLQYQWIKNGANISGANSNSYTTPPVTSADNGAIYSVVVSNGYGAAVSADAMMTVVAAVSFLTADAQTKGDWRTYYGLDGYNIIGDTVSYPPYATVSAADYTQYVWDSGTIDSRALEKVSGEDRIAACWYGSSFTITVDITDGQAHQVGLYCVDWDGASRFQSVEVLDAASGISLNTQQRQYFDGGLYLVWNITGKVQFRVKSESLNNNAVLSGIFFGGGFLPNIVQQPQGCGVLTGQSATFSVSANGSAPLSYQWFKDGVAISGAVFSSYTVPVVAAEDDGARYRVQVSNSHGSVTSDEAVLTLTAGIGLKAEYYNNSDFTDLKLTRTDATVDFDWGSGSPDPSIGADTFSVRWSGLIETPVNTDKMLYVKADNGVRMWFMGRLVIDEWNAQSGGEYSFAYRNEGKLSIVIEYREVDSPAAIQLSWSGPEISKQVIPQNRLYSVMKGVNPVITINPEDVLGASGHPVTLRCHASGQEPLSYQWYKNSVVIDGATQETYTTPDLVADDNGAQYHVVVSNSVGQVTSDTAFLEVINAFGNGLQAIYYDNSEFSNAKIARDDAAIDFSWGQDSPDNAINPDQFSGRWTGTLIPQTSGVYTLYVQSAGCVSLWVDGVRLIDNWSEHTMTEDSAKIELLAGKQYDIMLQYAETDADAGLRLLWSRSDMAKQIVSQTCLSHGSRGNVLAPLDPAKAYVLYMDSMEQDADWGWLSDGYLAGDTSTIINEQAMIVGEGNTAIEFICANNFINQFMGKGVFIYRNLGVYADGTLNFMIKAPSTVRLSVGVRCSYSYLNARIYSIRNGQYGYYADNEWHYVSIPISHLVRLGLDLSAITGFFSIQVSNITAGEKVYLDRVYYYQNTSPLVGTDAEPPSIPTGLTPTAISNENIRLNWNAAVDNFFVAGYTVLRDGAPVATCGANTLTYYDSGLSPNTPYRYAVRAFDAAGNISEPSNDVFATTLNYVSDDVIWTDLVGVTAQGSELTKTVAGDWGTGGAVSAQRISGDGGVRFAVAYNNKDLMCGLSQGNPDAHYNTIQYAFYMDSNTTMAIYEMGIRKLTIEVFSPQDVFEIVRIGTAVVYKKNDAVVYTSTVPSSGELLVDSALYSYDAMISFAELKRL